MLNMLLSGTCWLIGKGVMANLHSQLDLEPPGRHIGGTSVKVSREVPREDPP